MSYVIETEVKRELWCFKPISLVLETREEAELLFHLLNAKITGNFNNYAPTEEAKENLLDIANAGEKKEMFASLNTALKAQQLVFSKKDLISSINEDDLYDNRDDLEDDD